MTTLEPKTKIKNTSPPELLLLLLFFHLKKNSAVTSVIYNVITTHVRQHLLYTYQCHVGVAFLCCFFPWPSVGIESLCNRSWQMHTWSGEKNLEVRAICVAHRKLVSTSPWLTRAAGDAYLRTRELSLHCYPGYGCSSALNLSVAEQGCRTSGNQRCVRLHHPNYSVHET